MEFDALDAYLHTYLPEEIEYKRRFEDKPDAPLFPDEYDREPLIHSDGKYGILFETDSRCSVMVHRQWRYYPHVIHTHSFVEILYMYAGCGTNITETEASPLVEGDILILPPNVWHVPIIRGEDILVNFIVRTDFFERVVHALEADNALVRALRGFFSESHSKFIHLHSRGDQAVRDDAMRLILTSVDEGIPDRMTERECYLKLMLLRLVRSFGDDFTLSEHPHTQCDAIVRIHNLIANSYRDLTLPVAARTLNYSKSYICRTLKENTGRTFSEIVNHLRITYACRLLKEGREPVMMVASEAGFSNVEYFNRTFKRLCGISPGQYRNSLHKRHDFLPDTG